MFAIAKCADSKIRDVSFSLGVRLGTMAPGGPEHSESTKAGMSDEAHEESEFYQRVREELIRGKYELS